MKKDRKDQNAPKKRKWRIGDRNDGRRLRSLSPMAKIMPYIMPQRCDACNSFRASFDAEAVDKYVLEKRKEGKTSFTTMHVLLAAYLRVVSQRPGLNRFVMGQKIFARHEFETMLCIKKEMKLNTPDSVISMIYPLDATADEVYEITEKLIDEARNETTNFDDTARILDYIPGLIKKFVFWLLRLLDYFGLLPKWLKRISPFHGSLFITSMASLGLPPIYHHIYNFGNVPVFIALGVPEKKCVLKSDGTITEKRVVNYTVVTDERICDGYYFASAFRMLNTFLRNPWQLDKKPEKVEEDVD